MTCARRTKRGTMRRRGVSKDGTSGTEEGEVGRKGGLGDKAS